MAKKSGNSTIGDVAAAAGVSKTTVSRYMNGKYEYMSEETKKRLDKVVKAVGYQPSSLARGLKMQKSGLIGCVIGGISNYFSSEMLRGISDACVQNGYRLLFCETGEDPQREREAIQSMLDARVEGLVVNTVGQNDSQLKAFNKSGFPVVLADRPLKERLLLDTVTTENYYSTCQCIEHLHEQGYEHIAFFQNETVSNYNHETRRKAYKVTMRKLYKTSADPFIYGVDIHNEKSVRDAVLAFYESTRQQPATIFAVNSIVMLAVLRAYVSLGFSYEPDFSVCGFSTLDWTAAFPNGGITSIVQEPYKVGVQSVRLLVKRIRSKRNTKAKHVEVPNKLVIRRSTLLK